MIQSMTGYGKAVAELPNRKITIEIKSLNSKQLDLSTRLPYIYKEKDISLRNYLSRMLQRGKVDFTINVETISKNISTKINHDVLKQYLQDLKPLTAEMGIAEPQDWISTLLQLPEVMKQEVDEPDENEWNIIEKSIHESVEKLIEFRLQEGAMLEKLLIEKIENIRSLQKDLGPLEPERLERVKTKIVEGLSNLGNADYDKNRFEQEMIYYIEKLDVSEEKNRLTNHLNYFIETLNENTSQGKKLGFITQEIGREINTLGSKSNHSEMQRIVVQMKDELEQIKEQVLNVL